jgi:hypothetical protein
MKKELIECTPIEAIRMLSGMFNSELNVVIDRLSIICLITRVLEGDADSSFADKLLKKRGLKVLWEKYDK